MKHFIVGLVFVIALAGCAQAESVVVPTLIPTPEPPPATPIPATSAPRPTPVPVSPTPPPVRVSLRILNAIPDSAPLSVYAGFQAIATNLEYQQVTEPTPLDSATYTVRVVPTGAASNAPALTEQEISLSGDTPVLLTLTGTPDRVTLSSLSIPQSSLSAGESAVVLVNALGDAAEAALQDSTGTTVASAPTGQFAAIPALPSGTTGLRLQVGSTTLEVPVSLDAQRIYTVAVVGSSTNPAIVTYSDNAPGRIALRIVHAAVQVDALDLYLNDKLLSGRVEFGRPAPRQDIEAGEYNLTVLPAGADPASTTPLVSQSLPLFEADPTSLILIGDQDNLRLLVVTDDLSPTAPDESRVSLLNVLPDRPAIQVFVNDRPMDTIPELLFGEPPVTTNLSSERYRFIMSALDANGVRSTLELAERLQFEPGISYLYLVTGRMDSNPVIISETVGVDQATSAIEPGRTPALIRLIHAIDGAGPITLTVNEKDLLTDVTYGTSSTLLDIPGSTLTLNLGFGGSAAAASLEADLVDGNRYALVAAGSPSSPTLLLVSDDKLIFDGTSPYLRLINTSATEDAALKLAFSAASSDSEPTAAATPEIVATEEPVVGETVFTLPFGIQTLVADQPGGSASNIILMTVGVFNIYLIDPATNQILQTFPEMPLQGGVHYDVIATRDLETNAVEAVLVIHPDSEQTGVN
ncbi:MAG: DUF4397 domain-containing protein [Anaerolineae bacterium]|nr:DUF4397 domain-containing protein [Anaerolineae bacterium]